MGLRRAKKEGGKFNVGEAVGGGHKEAGRGELHTLIESVSGGFIGHR